MRRRATFRYIALALAFVWFDHGAMSGQEAIDLAKSRPLGSVVTLHGIAINGSTLGSIRFIQDTTGGIALYPGSGSAQGFESQVTSGTLVEVTGVLSEYHGLIEINPILSFEVLSQGNPLPDPVPVSLHELDVHIQSMLVEISCLSLRDGTIFGDGANLVAAPNGMESVVHLQGGHPLTGQPAEEAFTLTCIVSFYEEPQLLPRNLEDLSEAQCFRLAYGPLQNTIRADGFDLTWGTSDTAAAIMRIGTDLAGMEWTDLAMSGVDHTFAVNGLSPATFYYVQTGGVSTTGDTTVSPPIRMTTASALPGSIDIYFNSGIDESYSNGNSPAGTTYGGLYDNLISIILSAKQSIDVAMYNSNRDDIILKLEEAQNRGVRVRYIADGGQSNGALSPLPDFPVFFRQGEGIMHHKFIVVDPADAANAQIWTGSTNFSSGQLALDPNNSLHIRDQALARAYLMEFNEMWGGDGDVPNSGLSRTGAGKIDDTPHRFAIADINVECYFSPSDQTNKRIISTLRTAEGSVAMALLLITRNDIAATLSALIDDGVEVRGIVNDLETSGNIFNQLIQAGANMQVHDPSSIFHHKYALIDYTNSASDPMVITGSHNWTTSATTRNDENTLILHDADIANIFQQEFEARWSELISAVEDLSEAGFSVYPNPFSRSLSIHSNGEELTRLDLLALTGQVVTSMSVGNETFLGLTHIPPGAYLLRLTTSAGNTISTVVVKR